MVEFYSLDMMTKKNGKYLKQYRVSPSTFDGVLGAFPSLVRKVKDINEYAHGYVEKGYIAYDGDEYLICTESQLNYISLLEDYTPWKQCIIRADEGITKEELVSDITGGYAWCYMIKILSRYYTLKEIDEILKSFTNEYNRDLIQFHYVGFSDGYSKYTNCQKYDINGAHADALRIMFPKAEKAILKLYKDRKVKPKNKQLLNYFVGYMKHKGYVGAYNWVVQRTTKKLLEAIEEVGGTLLYANTDGFMVQNATRRLETSSSLGEFKDEYSGDVFSYVDKNYWCFLAKELVGNLLNEVRADINLAQGKVVHYERVMNEFDRYEAKNVITEELYGNYKEFN